MAIIGLPLARKVKPLPLRNRKKKRVSSLPLRRKERTGFGTDWRLALVVAKGWTLEDVEIRSGASMLLLGRLMIWEIDIRRTSGLVKWMAIGLNWIDVRRAQM